MYNSSTDTTYANIIVGSLDLNFLVTQFHFAKFTFLLCFSKKDIKLIFLGIENSLLVWNKHNFYWHTERILIRPKVLNELATYWIHMRSLKRKEK